MTRSRPLLTSILAFLPLVLLLMQTGCAGDSARVRALGPAMNTAWPGLEEDALLGVWTRQNQTAAAAMQVEWESPGVGEIRRERVLKFGEAVRTLNAKAAP